MASVFPALRGKIGDTEYFSVVAPASWVSANLVIPSDLDDWEDETVEERYQRRINYSRVRQQIAPYLANDPHRFFGALIVTAVNPEGMEWESVVSMAQGVPKVYRQAAQDIGFLTLGGKEVLVPIDGQHRLAAIKFAISGKDNEDKPIDGIASNPQIGNDLVTLLIIRHERERARKIFNKVNRYARPTSKADNLITSDDDFLAVLAREIAADCFSTRLVNTSSNTIASRAEHVTTLATIYAILEQVLSEERLKVGQVLDSGRKNLIRTLAKDFFTEMCEKVDVIRLSLMDPASTGDAGRVELRESCLLMKPFAQLAAAAAAHMLHQLGGMGGRQIKVGEALSRLNKLDWSRTNTEWQGVILNGDRMLSGQTARRFASRYIAYRLGGRFQPAEVAELEADYKKSIGGKGGRHRLPDPV